MGNMVAPDVYLYKEHRRHGERLAIEDSRHYFATAPFDLFLVIHHALPGCQHIIYDDNLFPFDFSGNEVVSFEDTLLSTFGLMQAFSCIANINVVQS